MKVNKAGEVLVPRGSFFQGFILVDVFVPSTRDRHKYVRTEWVRSAHYEALMSAKIWYASYTPHKTPPMPTSLSLQPSRPAIRTSNERDLPTRGSKRHKICTWQSNDMIVHHESPPNQGGMRFSLIDSRYGVWRAENSRDVYCGSLTDVVLWANHPAMDYSI